MGVLGLAEGALGFRLTPRMKRKTLLLVGAVGILFVVGTVFTEVWPVPVVIRAQFFRSSRLLFVIATVLVAHGCAGAGRRCARVSVDAADEAQDVATGWGGGDFVCCGDGVYGSVAGAGGDTGAVFPELAVVVCNCDGAGCAWVC